MQLSEASALWYRPAAEVVRKMGVSEHTFCRWENQYAGMGVGEIRRLR